MATQDQARAAVKGRVEHNLERARDELDRTEKDLEAAGEQMHAAVVRLAAWSAASTLQAVRLGRTRLG